MVTESIRGGMEWSGVARRVLPLDSYLYCVASQDEIALNVHVY